MIITHLAVLMGFTYNRCLLYGDKYLIPLPFSFHNYQRISHSHE